MLVTPSRTRTVLCCTILLFTTLPAGADSPDHDGAIDEITLRDTVDLFGQTVTDDLGGKPAKVDANTLLDTLGPRDAKLYVLPLEESAKK